MKKLKSFILNKKPHVIALSAENRTASRLADDVRTVLTELQEEEQIAPINVELVDNEVALISENSDKSKVGVGSLRLTGSQMLRDRRLVFRRLGLHCHWPFFASYCSDLFYHRLCQFLVPEYLCDEG